MTCRRLLSIWAGLSLLTLTTWIPGAGPGRAEVPHLINFQGILKDGSGNPVSNGNYSVTFRIYDASAGGNILWSEVRSVGTTSGLFTILLGAVTPVPDSAFNDTNRYLGIQVSPDPEMTPLQKLSSVGYSFRSDQWTSAGQNLFRLNGNVGIGTSSPGAKLDVGGALLVDPANSFVGVNRSSQVSAAEYFGVYAPSGNGLFGGMYLSTGGFDGVPFYGYKTLSQTAWTQLDGQTADWKLVINGSAKMTVQNAGEVSIGAPPLVGVRLYAAGGGGVSTGIYTVGSYEGIEADGGTIGLDGRGGTYGLYAYSNVNGGSAVYGDNGGNAAIYGGYFKGDVKVTGNLVVDGFTFKNGGGFRIDHPLDPANKYLYHSFVESPDMKNMYDGVVTTDSHGNATVTLPEWFGALNRDFRYQLTVIGQFAQAIVAKEISNNQFSIETDKPLVKVSWQVTGIRQDAYASAHRIPVEETKQAGDRAHYIHPEVFDQPDEKGTEWARHSELKQALQAHHQVTAAGEHP